MGVVDNEQRFITENLPGIVMRVIQEKLKNQRGFGGD